MPNPKILVVDDDRELVDSTKAILETQNYDVITGYSGDQCIAIFKKHKPDLILLDVMMDTDLDGYNTLHYIKKYYKNKNVPIIIMTGISDVLGVNLRDGVDDKGLFTNVTYLEKPVEPEDLLEEVKKILE